jgi:hypothetical protein
MVHIDGKPRIGSRAQGELGPDWAGQAHGIFTIP